MKKLIYIFAIVLLFGCNTNRDIASRIVIDLEKPVSRQAILFPVIATYGNRYDENKIWVNKETLQPVLKAGAKKHLSEGVNAYVLYNEQDNACSVVNLDTKDLLSMTKKELKKLLKQNCNR